MDTMISTAAFKMLLGLFILSSIPHSTDAGSYNDVCGPLLHCDIEVGLVCGDTSRCNCSSGPLTETYSFNLQWDFDRNRCVGFQGSACVGARGSKNLENMTVVPCAEPYSCIHLPGMHSFLGRCENVPRLQQHGIDCNENAYCDSTKGLVCNNGTCSCAAERPQTSPSYSLIWNEDAANCVAPVGSSCIGTKRNPVTDGHKTIECVPDAECIDVDTQPPSVGVCEALGKGSAGTEIRKLNLVALFASILVLKY